VSESLSNILDSINASVQNDVLGEDDLMVLYDAVRDHIKESRRRASMMMAAKIRRGAKVRISPESNLRPAYLLGTEGIVEKINQTTATIRLDKVYAGSNSRFRTGQSIRCPLNALELVEGRES
jgi:hypothetical protein